MQIKYFVILITVILFANTLVFGGADEIIFPADDPKIQYTGRIDLPFLHVMHPVMPMINIKSLDLPEFNSVFDEINYQMLNMTDPDQIQTFLFDQRTGTYQMLLLRHVKDGKINIHFKNGMCLKEEFSTEIYPTLGIYWNNKGYPDEEGCRRHEYAIEPIPGSTSELAESYNSGRFLSIEPGQRLFWQVFWRMD